MQRIDFLKQSAGVAPLLCAAALFNGCAHNKDQTVATPSASAENTASSTPASISTSALDSPATKHGERGHIQTKHALDQTGRQSAGNRGLSGSLPIFLTADGHIRRDALRALLELGPHAFIRRVDVRPTFRKSRFYGWRVISYQGPGQLYPGDVVIKVNSKSIERPEQFMAVWEQLAECEQLTIDMVRDKKPMHLSYRVVDHD